jgi:hypothetical protein
MSALTKDEALAFIEAIRLNLEGKTGFKWFVERLTSLSEYVESTSSENARLNAYLDARGSREDFESFDAEDQDDRRSAPVQSAD